MVRHKLSIYQPAGMGNFESYPINQIFDSPDKLKHLWLHSLCGDQGLFTLYDHNIKYFSRETAESK